MSENQQAGSQKAERWSDFACWVAVTLTLVVSAQHTATSSQWHDDLGLIRTLGVWPLGAQGVASIVLALCTSLLPIGNRILRAALAANLGAAAACWLYFWLVYRVLSANARTPRFSASLAMLSSLLLSLSVPMQTAATIAGGASVAVALCLATIAVHSLLLQTANAERAPRLQAAVGALLAMTLAEQYLAFAMALLVIGIQRATMQKPLARVATRATLLGALVTTGACSIPLLRMLRPHRSIPELPSLVSSVREGYGGFVRLGWSGSQTWADAGALLVAAAGLGAVWALAKPTLRGWALSGLAALVAANIVAAYPNALRESPTLPLRVVALACVALFASVAAQTLALVLLRTRLAYVGGSLIAIPALFGLLVAVHADEADIHAESAYGNGNEAFTQESIWTLPQGSVLLVRTQEIAMRLWAERLARGMRPDVLVISQPQLQYGTDYNRLLALEPALAPLIRETVLRGRASEYVLSQLADTRPLFVELDMSWDARVREHLAAAGLWLEFHSQSLGRSDRYAKMTATRPAVDRLIDVCKASVPPDRTTLRVVAQHLKDQALVSASLGDRAGVYPLLDELEKTGLAADFTVSLKRVLEEKARGPLDWSALQAL